MNEEGSSSSVSAAGESKEVEQPAAAQAESSSTVLPQASSKESQDNEGTAQNYVKGVAFFALMTLDFSVLGYVYLLLHRINFFELVRQPQTAVTFDFVGGSANAFSIIIEILFWALIGVICQIAYRSGQMIIKESFSFWKSMFNWMAVSLYAVGIATALIFSLQVISLDIAGIEITLANASIETIIAISFILGFFSEDSRRLLGGLRGKITTGIAPEKD